MSLHPHAFSKNVVFSLLFLKPRNTEDKALVLVLSFRNALLFLFMMLVKFVYYRPKSTQSCLFKEGGGREWLARRTIDVKIKKGIKRLCLDSGL